MQLSAVRILVSVVLLLAATVMWYFAGVARSLADAHDAMATMDFERVSADGEGGALSATSAGPPPGAMTFLDPDATTHGAIADYWRGRYDRNLLQFAANGTFRRLQRAAGGRPLAPEDLDQVLQAYAAVLKQDGSNRDAAFNYEYVARLRDRDRTRRAKPEPPPPAVSIHGRQGTHPPRTKGEEFEILTPMDYGDREAQPEPTPGKKLPRKG